MRTYPYLAVLMNQQLTSIKGLWSAWFVVLVAIPCLSYFGRSFQHWAAENIGYTFIGIFIALIILIMIIT